MGDYKDLIVWQKSIDLAQSVYEVTKSFPKEELYGLTSQMRRSAVSISSNIAEGSGRAGRKEFKQFLHIALGSASELETQLIISERTGCSKNSRPLVIEVTKIRKMLNALAGSLDQGANDVRKK